MIKPDQTVGRKKKRSAGLSPYGARMFPGRQMFQSPEASRFARLHGRCKAPAIPRQVVYRPPAKFPFAKLPQTSRRATLTDNGQDSPAHDYESEQRKRRQDEKSA